VFMTYDLLAPLPYKSFNLAEEFDACLHQYNGV
jgi:hypothetical protein